MLKILALLGFAYLMFLSGLEVNFDAVLPKKGFWHGSWQERLGSPVSLGLLTFVLTVTLAILAGWGLHTLDAADDIWLMALILSTTSLGLVMPVLKERELTGSPYGQTLLVTAVIADFATMLLVSVYVVLHTQGLSPEVFLVLFLFGFFATVYRLALLAHRHFPGTRWMSSISHATAQMEVRGAFAIGLAFIALAQGLGAEMILGAFLGGALISVLSTGSASDLKHKLEVFGYAFFMPIFFIMIGVRFDLPALLESTRALVLVPLILIMAYAVKLAAAVVFRLEYSWRQTLAGGALLSSRLSLIIAVAAIGLQLGSIDAATNSAIILVAIVTSTLSPLLFSRIAPVAPKTHRKFIIVGAGRLPRLLARRIAGHGQKVFLVDHDENRASAVEEIGMPFIQGDPFKPAMWKDLKPETIQAVGVLLPDDEANLEVCGLLRGEFGISRVISRAQDAMQVYRFTELGVQVINPSLSPVVELEYLLLCPSVSSLISDLEDDHDIEVRLGCPDLTGRPLRELDLPQGVIIVLVRRDGKLIYPRGQTELQMGDRLTFMGSLEAVRELAHHCE